MPLRRRAGSLLVLAATILALPVPGRADSDRHPRALVIDHAAGCWVELPRAKRDHGCLSLGRAETLSIRPDDEVTIQIANANPFFYRYKLGESQAIESADMAVLKEFTKNLGPIVTALQALAGGSQNASIKAFRGDLAAMAAARSFTTSLGLPAETADETLKEIADRLEALRGMADLVPAWTARTLDPQGVAGVQAEVRDRRDEWKKIQDLSRDLSNLRNTLTDLNRQLAAGELATLDPPKQAAVTQFLVLHAQIADATQARAKILEFKATLEGLKACAPGDYDRCETLPLGSVTKADTKRVLSIGATDTPAPKSSTRLTGDFDFQFRPYNPFKYSVGPSVVYVFAEEVGEKDVGTRTAIMLSVTPRQWDFGTFSPSFQLGVTPDEDQLGLYAGLQLKLGAGMSLGGGVTRQQIKKDDESTYKWGAYMHLSYAR